MKLLSLRASLAPLLLLCAWFPGPLSGRAAAAPVQDRGAPWWGDGVTMALVQAGDARPAWLAMLREAPRELRGSLAYLVAGMPAEDLRELAPERVLEETRLAHEHRASVPWGKDLPEHVFLDAVLPYANVTESRDPWRAELHALCRPLVEDCATPGEAALVLNRELFGKVGVKYSTERRRADQSPKESIEQGLASCTGLSILLADACRSVAVPARLAGTADWAEKDGNHTWVEVWDDGAWHFVGAAEPDEQGLDHAWFAADAARAKAGDPRQGIYAVTWRPGDTRFPMVWAPRVERHGVEVTARYTGGLAAATDPSLCALRIVLRDRPGGRRVVENVRVSRVKDTTQVWEGTTRGESSDLNDMLSFEVPRGEEYLVQVHLGEQGWAFPWQTRIPDAGVHVYRNDLWSIETFAAPGDPKQRVGEWFAKVAGNPDERFPDESFRGRDPEGVREAILQAWEGSERHAQLRADFAEGRVRTADRTSPWVAKQVGERPAGGWPLVIAMHGGGGAPPEVNDSQWEVMQRYYKDHPEVSGYRYLALRAPNDEWNGFYDDRICPLVDALILQQALCADVDLERVHLIGYSHGGYGAFVIGTKIPWRFATVHSSAAAPTDGETRGENLMNTPFSYMVGERDTAYGRRERCEAFAKLVEGWRAEHPGRYPVEFLFQPGHGHGGLPDRDRLAELLPVVRETLPRELMWVGTDDVLTEFSWLGVDGPSEGHVVHATIDGNRITVRAQGVEAVRLGLDGRLVDLEDSVVVVLNGEEHEFELGTEADPEALARTLLRKGDPALAFGAELRVEL